MVVETLKWCRETAENLFEHCSSLKKNTTFHASVCEFMILNNEIFCVLRYIHIFQCGSDWVMNAMFFKGNKTCISIL